MKLEYYLAVDGIMKKLTLTKTKLGCDDTNINIKTMQFQVIKCQQCGAHFKRTNPRQTYCRAACRVAAHRDRHGFDHPIFNYSDIKAIAALRSIDIGQLRDIQKNLINHKGAMNNTSGLLEVEIHKLKVALGEDVKVNVKVNSEVTALCESIEIISKIQRHH